VRLVHLSDLHLGFRQYQRLTTGGINQREADVAASFQRAVDVVIGLAPDLVLVAGDVFHTVRPPNPAILHAFQQFARLRRELAGAEIVMVAGNHDTPRTAETGCILRLFAPLGIHVVDAAAQRLSLPALETSVLAVPDLLGQRPALVPDPTARYNVLLLHGEIAGVLPEHAREQERATTEITTDELGAERWDYVALGHYHVYRQVAPNAYYSGSLEYTSANPWGELREERSAGLARGPRQGKGLIERDLATGHHAFHPLPVTRSVLDLHAIGAAGMGARELDAAIAERVAQAAAPVEDAVVRVVVRDVPRHIARELDQKVIRDLKRSALHFHLDLRRPEVTRRTVSGAPGRRPSLAETLREKLETRQLVPGVERSAFVERGLDYLRSADALAIGTNTPAADEDPA